MLKICLFLGSLAIILTAPFAAETALAQAGISGVVGITVTEYCTSDGDSVEVVEYGNGIFQYIITTAGCLME